MGRQLPNPVKVGTRVRIGESQFVGRVVEATYLAHTLPKIEVGWMDGGGVYHRQFFELFELELMDDAK